TSPFMRDVSNLRVMLLPPFQNPLILPFVVIGLIVGLHERQQLALLAAGWLLLVLDVACFGVLEALTSFLPIWRYDYPFSVAWHGVIIPYAILGGIGVLWAWDRWLAPRLEDHAVQTRVLSTLMSVCMAVMLLLALFNQQVLS